MRNQCDLNIEPCDYTVYMHKNKFDGKMYVGITCQDPKKRWLNGHGYSFNPHFNRAIQKYGWDNFEHIIVAEKLSKSEAENMEVELISKYNLTNQNIGYNLGNGGCASGRHTEETKKKISDAHKGLKHSEETKQKLSKLFTGRKLSVQWLENRTKAQTGLKRSRETIQRMSDAESVAVICINNRKVYKSLTEASKLTNTQIGHISSCCNGTRPRAGTDEQGNGLFWMFYSTYLRDNLSSKSNEEIIPKLKKEKCSLPIRCIETNEIFESPSEIYEKLNICKSSLSSCLHGKYKTAGGLHWEFVNE